MIVMIQRGIEWLSGFFSLILDDPWRGSCLHSGQPSSPTLASEGLFFGAAVREPDVCLPWGFSLILIATVPMVVGTCFPKAFVSTAFCHVLLAGSGPPPLSHPVDAQT